MAAFHLYHVHVFGVFFPQKDSWVISVLSPFEPLKIFICIKNKRMNTDEPTEEQSGSVYLCWFLPSTADLQLMLFLGGREVVSVEEAFQGAL